MAYEPDIAAVGPALELTLDEAKGTLRCAGTLEGRTGRHVVAAVERLLRTDTRVVEIDVDDLDVTDVGGSDALAAVQRLVTDAGVTLRWRGLDADHLRGNYQLRHRARRPRTGARRPIREHRPAWHPSMMPTAT